MGRDWYWSGKPSTTSNTNKVDIRETPPGCMSGVLHLFDFHQFQFPITQSPCFKPNSILQQDPTPIKGVEAPRNSLEEYYHEDHGSSSVSMELKQQHLDIPVEIRVLATDTSSDTCASPGPKTPSLVARLMGLDTLSSSSASSPSSSSVRRKCKQSNYHKKSHTNFIDNEIVGSRSLPDTPRISSARRSDVGPRFSLQLNKENMMSNEEIDYYSRISNKIELRNEQDNRSPGHYARQIVKQVKQSVSRRVGLDITNTNSRAKSKQVELVLVKSKKTKRLTKIGEESNSNKQHSTLSNSNLPRLKLCETAMVVDKLPISPIPLSKPRPPPVDGNEFKSKSSIKPKSKSQPLPQHPTMEKCKKASCERFTQRKEASKPHLNQLPKEITTLTTETCASTSSHHHQYQGPKPSSRLSSCSSRAWCVTPTLNDRDDNNNDQTSFADEIRYVSEILKCTGVNKDTLVSLTRWYSPFHPLDPSIFHHLENYTLVAIGPLKHRSNRRLIFNLVDEILANVIKPYLNMKPWFTRNDRKFVPRDMRGDQLLQCLSSEIKKFPTLKCETLQDIDNLIEKDLPGAKMRKLPTFEESESIVFEIEQDILDSLLHETAADVIQKRRHNTWAFT